MNTILTPKSTGNLPLPKRDRRPFAYSLYLGPIPVVLYTVLTMVLHLVFHDHPVARMVFEPPLLLPVLHMVFLCLTSFAVSYITARSYLLNGSGTVLFLGCGLLTLGVGSFFAGWLMSSQGPNANVTVFNTAALLSSIFHFVGMVENVLERPPEKDLARRRRKLGAGYGGVLAVVTLLSYAAAENMLPPFFIQESGPTLLRQTVLIIALLLFAISSSSMMIRFVQQRAIFLYWYSLGLALLALTLGAAFLQPTVGSPIGWVGRIAQYTAGIYFFAAAYCARQEARTQGISVGETVADLFSRSQRKIASILDGITDSHYELDGERRFIQVNDRALKHFGKKREEVIGKNFFDVLPATRHSVLVDYYEKIMSGQDAHFEMFSILVPGTWVEFHGYPAEQGISVFFRDITERKRVEEELRKSRDELNLRVQERTRELTEALAALKQSAAKYKDLYDHANDIIFTTDLKGRITSANRKAMELFSHGHTLSGIPSMENILTPESYRFVAALIERAVAHNSDLLDEQPWEFEARTRDGSAIFLEVKARLIRENGVISGIQGIARDVSQRRKLEEERARLSSVVERAGEGMFIATLDKRYSYVNDAFCTALGFAREELLGKSTAITRSDRHEPGFHDAVWQRLQGGEAWSGRQTRRRKDGSLCIVEVTLSPIRNQSGAIVYYIGVERDITHQLQIEEQLRQAHKMEAIGTLAGGIAHDFNNMLAVIIGNAELALDEVEDEGARGNLDQILKASKRSRDLIRQILTFSRKSAGEGKEVNMVSILKETYALLRASLPTTIHMELNIRTEADVPIVAQPSEIQQVVVNLANNAAYAMREHGGSLTIELSSITLGPGSLPEKNMRPGRHAKITVKDTGTGISPEVQKRMFDPFFTTKDQGQGTGMGLAVVYGIVKSHKGTIEAESEDGKGSTFTILLPLSDGPAVTEEEKEGTSFPASGEHILFVDDEPAVADMAKAILERLGFRVTALTHASQALKMLSENPDGFDLVITDQTMPYMTGMELAQKILEIQKRMPIILCTGYSETVSPEKAKEVGVREFVMKPITKQEVAETIRRVLDSGESV